jgi:hypothetical protein
MPPVGFEPTILTGEGPKTYALERAATGTGFSNILGLQNSVTRNTVESFELSNIRYCSHLENSLKCKNEVM